MPYYATGTDKLIIGTLETMQGVAKIGDDKIGEDGQIPYAGDTEIFWDEQKTVVDGNGERVWVDEDYTAYPESEIEWRDA